MNVHPRNLSSNRCCPNQNCHCNAEKLNQTQNCIHYRCKRAKFNGLRSIPRGHVIWSIDSFIELEYRATQIAAKISVSRPNINIMARKHNTSKTIKHIEININTISKRSANRNRNRLNTNLPIEKYSLLHHQYCVQKYSYLYVVCWMILITVAYRRAWFSYDE